MMPSHVQIQLPKDAQPQLGTGESTPGKTWLFSLKNYQEKAQTGEGFSAQNLKAMSQKRVERRGISQIWTQEKSMANAKIMEIDKTSCFN